jgi:translation elongation factor EF-Ts
MKVKFNEEMADSGKPADIIEKIVAWKLQKQWKDLVLLEQLSIVDDSQSVKAKLGETTVSQFIRFAI